MELFKTAIKDADAALAIDPTCTKAWERKGQALEAQGKRASALEAWKQARCHSALRLAKPPLSRPLQRRSARADALNRAQPSVVTAGACGWAGAVGRRRAGLVPQSTQPPGRVAELQFLRALVARALCPLVAGTIHVQPRERPRQGARSALHAAVPH
jgi:tetratricopeptide (TPR) repeat protein